MWTRALYWLRGLPPKASELLASWKTSVALMAIAALYYALLAIWSRSSPSHVVQNIAGLAPFGAVYALLLLSTGWCLWRRLPALLRDVRRGPAFEGASPRWESASPADSLELAAATIRTLGYRVEIRERAAWGVRRRWSALGTYLFHTAFFVVALGFVLTAFTREESKLWVAVGEEYTGARAQVLSREAPRVPAFGGADAQFTVEEIVPELWQDQLLFTELSARLRMSGGATRTTRINEPVWLSPASFLRLSGFGYALRYEILSADGKVLDTSFAKLNVFPPGQRDAIVPGELPHRLYVEVFPDLETAGGAPSTRSLNLRSPGFRVHAFRGKVDLGQQLLRPGEPMKLEDLVLRIPEVRYWGEFSLLSDPGAPLVILGFLLALAGLSLKFRGGRAEVRWAGGTLQGYGAARPPKGARP